MPTLQLEDIPKESAKIPTDMSEQQNVTMLQHELFTNDVLYMETALDMRTLPPNLLPLIPLFCRCVWNAGGVIPSTLTILQQELSGLEDDSFLVLSAPAHWPYCMFESQSPRSTFNIIQAGFDIKD